MAYKIKRHSVGGAFTSHLDTPPRDCPSSDTSSDNEVDGSCAHRAVMAAVEKNAAGSGTPVSGWGKKKAWRRKRRQSNSKDDKPHLVGFLEKVTNSDLLTRKQTLPPLNTLATAVSSHDLDCEPATPNLDNPGPPDTGSRESTPRPTNSGTPITPDGSFALEVSELLESVRHPHRNVSNSSTRAHKRQGSNGSFAGCSLETTPLRGHSTPTTAISSKRASIELVSSRRESSSGVPYTRMDSLSSESNSEKPDVSPISITAVPFPKQGDGEVRPTPRHPTIAKDATVYSNDSMDTQHESDGQGHEADGESTSDGCEKRFYRFSTSGTEPNETQESNIESSAPSPSLAESDDLTSSSAPDVVSRVSANPLPHTRSEVSGYGSQTGFPDVLRLPSLSNQSQLEGWSHDTTPTPTKKDSAGRHGSTSLGDSMMMSSAEYSQLYSFDEPDASLETSLTGFTMPFHLRRLENHDDGKYS